MAKTIKKRGKKTLKKTPNYSVFFEKFCILKIILLLLEYRKHDMIKQTIYFFFGYFYFNDKSRD